MELLPITLHAQPGNWRIFQARKTNKNFQSLANRILKRDFYACRFCGFQSKKYMEIVNIDNDYTHNSSSNLATACSFCAQCFFLDSIGLDGHSGGRVIYLPEMSQASLNHFSRALFCALVKDATYRGKLQATYLCFSDRGTVIENCFGPETSQPNVFGQGLIDGNLTAEQKNHHLMNAVRLLPLRRYFSEQITYWKETIFAHLPL